MCLQKLLLLVRLENQDHQGLQGCQERQDLTVHQDPVVLLDLMEVLDLPELLVQQEKLDPRG